MTRCPSCHRWLQADLKHHCAKSYLDLAQEAIDDAKVERETPKVPWNVSPSDVRWLQVIGIDGTR